MIIANSLPNGFVVFLTAENGWAHDIDKGVIAESDAEADAMLRTAKQAEHDCAVVDPNLITVEIVDGQPCPTEYREYIRATGPSVPTPS
ncbi:MAG: hypothetical protein CL799_13495 [Chromatiales bacterium]|jgi:hypothetical protein|nr:hypothetical protein [Chromatiales bacterium]MDP6151000.1 DUF2849 domain-containing protein [Gammaproteobacteria bacterium]MDP7093636.1 DUF2849 domain-containing protein [Gammaproteobacteria bacterium]MDP7271157.1 DUF2849 domain-containing protein [Gammaproteobacteria bacterium]HJP04248.1 DUF2849 domain-containing protein [Gammaproteobacteria bacterium]